MYLINFKFKYIQYSTIQYSDSTCDMTNLAYKNSLTLKIGKFKNISDLRKDIGKSIFIIIRMHL